MADKQARTDTGTPVQNTFNQCDFRNSPFNQNSSRTNYTYRGDNYCEDDDTTIPRNRRQSFNEYDGNAEFFNYLRETAPVPSSEQSRVMTEQASPVSPFGFVIHPRNIPSSGFSSNGWNPPLQHMIHHSLHDMRMRQHGSRDLVRIPRSHPASAHRSQPVAMRPTVHGPRSTHI
ncbi:uncharacterized protein LOC143471313 [Clavelina lepadiformis]